LGCGDILQPLFLFAGKDRRWGIAKSIAILGGGQSWARAPFVNPLWEIWSHASCFEGMTRADRWFDVHTPEVRAGEKSWSKRYRGWLTDPAEGRGQPVYVLDGFKPAAEGVATIENADIFNHVVYPRAEVEAWLQARGAVQREYTTSTAAWMFKLALFEGATTIGIWGINYDEHAEYLVQRPCMEHWIGFARALGVKVYVTPTSKLCRDEHVYGADGPHKDLVHTYQPFRVSAQRITVLQAMKKAPMHSIPPAIQKLIDEERELVGMDAETMWNEAASKW
jgi:hypothetical protein